MDVPPDRLRRFFIKTDDSYPSKSIRDLAYSPGKTSVVIRRFQTGSNQLSGNTLLYLELQKKVIQLFHYALKPDGFLLLSPAEAIGGLSRLFIQVEQKQKLYAKASPPARPEVAIRPRFFMPKSEPVAPSEPGQPTLTDLSDIGKVADSLLLQHYTPRGVIIDSKLQVLQFRLHRSFLEHPPGTASLDLTKWVRAELAGHLTRIAKL